jgi:hypothetical protein
MEMNPFTVIDFEASSLVDGFPVSVGIARSDGQLFYALVKPHAEWDMGYRWDPNSEAIHGLSRQHLMQHGHEAAAVVADMKNMFGDAAYMSDAPGHDKNWLDELISVSGITYAPRMYRATTEMWMTTLFDEHRVETNVVLKIKELRAKMHTHNALSDAAAWVAAEEAVRVWCDTHDLAACEAVFAKWKKHAQVIVIGVEQIEKYSEALNELSKR